MTFRNKAGFISLILVFLFALAGYSQENADEYRKTIEMADSYFAKGDYINAKASYQIAVRLSPEEQYPKDMLQQSLDMIKVQMNQNLLYTQKIQVADELLGKNDLEAALKAYQEALAILPGDSYATDRIQEIGKNMVDARSLEENFHNSIIKGDQFFKEGQLEQAIAEYRNASSLKPAEAYPKEKSVQVEKMLADSKTMAGDYESLLKEADIAISHYKYDEAISLIEAALRLKPLETQPEAKLAEVQKLKAAWDSYAKIIGDADNLYIAKDFEKAKEKYLQAQSVKPADEYPKRMLEKIDIALMDISKADRSSYEVTIALADKLFNQEDYERAIVEYNNALRFKPDEEYAKQRITDINNALSLRKTQEEAYVQSIAKADKLFNDQLYEDARDEYAGASGIKPLEQYPKIKIEEINTMLSTLASKKALYDNLIKGADRLFFSDEYEEAREQYRQASEVFPKEQYPNDQIVMINEILGTRDKYMKAITKADMLLSDKKYDEAKLEFRNAASINPKEEYPLQKIKEIETILAYNAKPNIPAKNLGQKVPVDEEEPTTEEEYQEALAAYQKEKVYELESDSAAIVAIASNDQQYQDIIAVADKSLFAKDYKKALIEYESAVKLMPGELYAHGKIDEINRILSEIAAKDTLEKQDSTLDKQFADVISSADNSILAKDYEKALTDFQLAQSLKPGEMYPKEKISEIEVIKEENRKQDEINNQYDKIMADAGKYLANEQYEEARTAFQEALQLKPSEDLPNKQITDIDKKLEIIAAELEQAYQSVIAQANAYFDQQEFEKAKVHYENALAYKPNDPYPISKIEQAEEQLMKKMQSVQAEYDKAIADADRFFASKIYDNAIESYRASSVLKPGEAYPKEMASRILKLLSERSIVQINDDPLVISNNTEYKFEFIPIPARDRKSNYIFFRARNVTEKDYKLIISYGKDQAKNGGFVVKVPAGKDLYEFIVRISAQYKWFSDENNWITFYPEGGDFEVNLVQISYSD